MCAIYVEFNLSSIMDYMYLILPGGCQIVACILFGFRLDKEDRCGIGCISLNLHIVGLQVPELVYLLW